MSGSRLVAVTGAAGKTGRAVTAALAERGVPVRALVHRPEQAAAGVPGASQTLSADLTDALALDEALSGAAALYLIAPNVHPDEPGLLGPVIAACQRSGPTRVVYHSVMHPYAPAMRHHLDKARVEALLHDSDLDWTILQPASYFENALGVWDSVRSNGSWPLQYSAQSLFTAVSLADVAEVAAMVLIGSTHRYATYELAGPEVLSTADMARIAAKALDREIAVTVDRRRPDQPPAASVDGPSRLQAMFDHYDQHGFCGNATVLTALLGRSPRTWQDWVEIRR